jgi:hypothetical protein
VPEPVQLPTLDEVAARPDIVSRLPRPVLQALAIRALTVHQACALALVGNVPDAAPAADELLSAAAVAELMGGLSRRQIYRQARQFPFSTFVVRPTPGLVRFRRCLVQEYLQDPDAYRVRHAGAAAPRQGARVRRVGRDGS